MGNTKTGGVRALSPKPEQNAAQHAATMMLAKPGLPFSAMWKAMFCIVPLILLSGCVTNYGVAAFKSAPDGVQVFDMEDGSVIGVTPVNFLWRSGKTKRKYMNVRMHKDGYQDAVKSFWLSLGHGSAKDAYANPQLVQFELIKVAE